MISKAFKFFAPLADLVARLYVAYHFFISGLYKYHNFDATVKLFTNKYKVPLIHDVMSPYWQTITASGIELIFPVLLAIGFWGHFSAFVLLVFNLLALYSFDFLWGTGGALAFWHHIYWALLLLMLATHGSGSLSLDRLLFKEK